MYRKITLTEEEGTKLEIKIYPDENYKMETVEDETSLTLNARNSFRQVVEALNRLMAVNTISKVEAVEVAEEGDNDPVEEPVVVEEPADPGII